MYNDDVIIIKICISLVNLVLSEPHVSSRGRWVPPTYSQDNTRRNNSSNSLAKIPMGHKYVLSIKQLYNSWQVSNQQDLL